MTTRDKKPLTNYRLPPNRLDFVRFALATLVILSHSFPAATGTEAREPLALLTNRQLTFGAVAVDCFFIISGFLILHSWMLKPDLGSFLGKRVRRIYPGFIVAATLGALVVAPLTSRDGYSSVTSGFLLDFAANVLRLQAPTPGFAFPDNPSPGHVNGSLWSISFEFWCYIGILLLGLANYVSRRKFLAICFVLSILASFVFSWRQLTPGGKILGMIFGYPPFWARLLPFFLAGMVLYLYRDKVRFTHVGFLISAAALVIASQVPYGMIFVLPAAAAYILFWFAFLPGRFLIEFARSGDFSYGIYLYSFPVLQIIVMLSDRPLAPWLLFLLGWAVAVACGALSWNLLEKHFVRSRQRESARPALNSPTLDREAT